MKEMTNETILLVLANKQDMPNALSKDEVLVLFILCCLFVCLFCFVSFFSFRCFCFSKKFSLIDCLFVDRQET
jgi:hypothetical protein